MYQALHPFEMKRISIEEYRREFGAAPIDRTRLIIPNARCPKCFNSLSIRAPSRREHFWHAQHRCVDTRFGHGVFEGLTLAPENPQRGGMARAEFRQTWRSHYSVLVDLIPKFSVDEFIVLLERATAQRMWDLVDFPQHLIPYLFAMLADFPPRTGLRTRRFWYRFWLPAPNLPPQALWIERPEITQIVQGMFTPPIEEDGFPDPDEFDFELKPIRRNFVADNFPSKHQFIETRVDNAFQALRFPPS